MNRPLTKIVAALSLASASVMLSPTQALAQEAGPIEDDELADIQLHAVHGDTDVAVDDAERIDDFEVTQSISWVQLDNWFSEDGADIIAANIARESSSALFAAF